MVDIFIYEINFINASTNVHIVSISTMLLFKKAYTSKFESDLEVLPKCPLTDVWIKKMWYIYTMEYEPQKRIK